MKGKETLSKGFKDADACQNQAGHNITHSAQVSSEIDDFGQERWR